MFDKKKHQKEKGTTIELEQKQIKWGKESRIAEVGNAEIKVKGGKEKGIKHAALFLSFTGGDLAERLSRPIWSLFSFFLFFS